MAPETVASASPDAMHARADSGATVNQFRIVFPQALTWALVLAVLVAIGAGIALGYSIAVNRELKVRLQNEITNLHNTVQVKTRLNSYDLKELETGKVAWLIGEVQNNHDLIQNYGIGNTCRSVK